MRATRAGRKRNRRRILSLALASVMALAPALLPAQPGGSYRIEKGEVKVTVPLKPGGAFEAKSTSLSGTLAAGAGKPMPLTGEVVLDLLTIDTGIALRNQHLQEKYLEIAKGPRFQKAVLSGLRLDDADGEGFQGRTGFTGKLLLHGAEQAVSGTAEIRRTGGGIGVEASFPLTLTDFGVEPPMYLGVGVASRIFVKVQLSLAPSGGAGR